MDTLKVNLPPKCAWTSDEGNRIPITSIELRETDGRDEEVAAQLADAKGKGTTLNEQLVLMSITKVNGSAVPSIQAFSSQFNAWNSRARQFAMRAFLALNGVTKEEGDRFLEDAESGTS